MEGHAFYIFNDNFKTTKDYLKKIVKAINYYECV